MQPGLCLLTATAAIRVLVWSPICALAKRDPDSLAGVALREANRLLLPPIVNLDAIGPLRLSAQCVVCNVLSQMPLAHDARNF